MPRPRSPHLIILVSALIASRILFIQLMPASWSTDLYSWLRVMDILDAGGNPYKETFVLNWPPFWMQILFGIQKAADFAGLSRITGIQTVLIACELIVVCILYVLGRRYGTGRSAFSALLWGMALNPVSLYLSCMHCNYDVFVGLWVLLAVWMIIEYSRRKEADAWLMACFFTGMGILAKTVPVILLPLLLTGIRELTWRSRIFGVLLLGAPFVIGMSVLFTLEPYGVLRNVFNYRSMGGWYGITGLMWTLGVPGGIPVYKLLAPLLLLAVIGTGSWLAFRKVSLSPERIVTAALALLVFIPTFGPGYTPPYILWFLPLGILLYILSSDALVRNMLIWGWVITIITYTIEYAILSDHGAFLVKMLPEGSIRQDIGNRQMQTLTRLPMFIWYVALFIVLIRSLRRAEAHTIGEGGISRTSMHGSIQNL